MLWTAAPHTHLVGFSRVHVSNYAVQQVRLAAKETHGSLQHSKKRRTKKTTLFRVLIGFPLSGLLNAGMHLYRVPDTPGE